MPDFDLAGVLRPGDHVVVGQGAAEPELLVSQLIDAAERVGPLTVFCGLSLARAWARVTAQGPRVVSYCAHGAMRPLGTKGLLDLVPCHYSELARFFRTGRMRADVVLLQLPPADGEGLHSLGCSVDYVYEAALTARAVVAEVNEQMPRTVSSRQLPASQITGALHTDRPLAHMPERAATQAEQAVAQRVADLIPDGATIQLGVGAIAAEIARALHGHRGLKVRSGLVGDWLPDLVNAGALEADGANGGCLTGMAVGSERLYEFLRGTNPARFVTMDELVDPAELARTQAFVSVNSALAVDLSGQISAEAVHGRYVGAVGGQVDFLRATRLSEGGLAVIALPATNPSGTETRIVSGFDGPVTSPQSDVDVVVTEYGAAQVRATSLRTRFDALVDVAAPAHREALRKQQPAG